MPALALLGRKEAAGQREGELTSNMHPGWPRPSGGTI